MRRFLDILRALALIAAVAALTGAAGVEWLLAREIHKGLLRDLPDILAIVKSGAANFASASQSIDSAAKDQSASLKEELAEFRKATAKVNDFVGHLDVSVNGTHNHPELGLIPTTTEAVADQNAELLDLDKGAIDEIGDLHDAVLKAQPILANLNGTAESLKSLAADPQLVDSLAQLDTAIKKGNAILVKFDAGAATADAAMAIGDDMMKMLDAELKQALKPASVAKSILERLLGLVGPIAEVGLAVSSSTK